MSCAAFAGPLGDVGSKRTIPRWANTSAIITSPRLRGGVHFWTAIANKSAVAKWCASSWHAPQMAAAPIAALAEARAAVGMHRSNGAIATEPTRIKT